MVFIIKKLLFICQCVTIKEKNQESSILIVVDSDGDEKETRQMIAEKIAEKL